MKDKKNIISVCLLLLVVTVLGVSYAWFNAKIENLNSKVSTVTTGSLKIKYVDGEEISLSNMIPGNYVTKEFSVSNVGDEAVSFNLELETIENTVLKNELVISASCTRLNGETIEGTCNNINEKSISSSFLSRNITIEPNITYKYEIKLLFKNTNRNQNYNMSAKYNGKINVREYNITDGIYCRYDGKLTKGAEYINGQYTYRYKQAYLPDYNSQTESYIWTDMEEDGWGVTLSDKESTDPVTSELCTYINDKPISVMSFMFSDSKASSIDLSKIDTSNVIDMSGMFYNSSFESLDLSGFETSNVTDMMGMFYNSKATTFDVSSFDTSKVIDMSRMFSRIQTTSLDLSGFDTSNVTNMSYMFYYTQVPVLDVSNFDTGNVTNMDNMFNGSLPTTLDLSNFNTENVTSMVSMFGYSQVTTIKGLEKFNTGKVTNMYGMFIGSKVTSLNLTNFDTSKVTNMTSMFRNSKITSLNLSSFNTSNVIYMNYMFDNTNLDNLNLSGFNTSKVTSMAYMFSNSKFSTLDLSSFDTSMVTNMSNMFYNCTNLKTIYVSSKFVTNKVRSGTNMFTSDSNLVGGAGTIYDANNIDVIYARIDGGTSSPGYFTSK